jgi:hypothetical protein
VTVNVTTGGGFTERSHRAGPAPASGQPGGGGSIGNWRGPHKSGTGRRRPPDSAVNAACAAISRTPRCVCASALAPASISKGTRQTPGASDLTTILEESDPAVAEQPQSEDGEGAGQPQDPRA